MKTRRWTILLANVLLVTVLCATVGEGQQDQRALARQLLQGSRAERSRALETASGIGRATMDADLRAALITVLERNNRIVVEAANRKEPVATVEDPEFIAHVAHVVSQLEDSQAIPALAGALGTGSTLVRDALADFGERAAPTVLAVVSSPASHYSAIDEGLIALRFMVERTGPRPLSAGTLEQIRGAAKQRLTGTQYFTTLWRAIDLALALHDAELQRIVESLATNRDTVVARGIESLDLIKRTQERAAGGLAGAPPLPKYRSHAERSRLLDSRKPR